jgi:hypothetical protein
MMIPIPERMAHLERDRRGYPIPEAVYRDQAGRPHFAVNDEVIRQRHLERELCPICGGKLHRGRWFVGGPLSAFSESGLYIDPPMHAECARYALQACPYLAAPNYSQDKRIDAATLPVDDPNVIVMDPTMIPERPEVFVAVMSIGQRLQMGDLPNGGRWIRYVAPVRPVRRAEFWRHGLLLDQRLGQEIAARAKLPADGEIKQPRLLVRPGRARPLGLKASKL